MAMNKVPTLLIGLGGIGCRTADMVYTMLGEEEKQYVGVIGIDTNVEDLKKLHITSIRISDERKVKDYLLAYPEYREWFPVNKFLVNRGMLTGAGQIRAISRMSALAAIERGEFVALSDEIKRILKHTGDKDNTAFNVFFLGSITGGTGAGLFLQMPFYLRNHLRQEYSIQNIRIRGMFISADITRDVQPSRINRDAVMVNAYACIKELNAFYLTQIEKDEDNLLNIEYYEKADIDEARSGIKKRILSAKSKDEFGYDVLDDFSDFDIDEIEDDAEEIASEGANIPYDAFYLIEGTDNQGGIGNSSLDTVERQIAKMVFTLLFTPVKAADAGIGDNGVLSDMEGGGMNRYSSSGLCAIRYPKEQVAEYVTMRWMKDLVKSEWLIIDEMYEAERKDAMDQQKTDPSARIPKIEEAYVRIFNKETSGGEGHTLGQLRGEAYQEGSVGQKSVCETALIFKRIDQEIQKIMSSDEIENCRENCTINMKKVSEIDVADKEINRVYDELKELEKIIRRTVESRKFEIANTVFPGSLDSLKKRKESELCIYKLFSNVHPVTARFFCYQIILELERKIGILERSVSGIDLDSYDDIDFYGGSEDGIQNAADAVIMVRNKLIPIIQKGKGPLRGIVSKFYQMVETQKETLETYGRETLQLCAYKSLKKRFEKLAEYYADFFANIREMMNNNESSLEMLEKSFVHDGFGEISVYSSPEAFRRAYEEFKLQAEFELPADVRERLFTGIYAEACTALNEQAMNLGVEAKRATEAGIQARLRALFDTGVVRNLKGIVSTKGKNVIDMNIRQAIEKEMRLKYGNTQDDPDYEERRIAYESEIVQKGMLIAAPMMAVEPGPNTITEMIFLAINPEASEMLAGKPDVGITKEHLIPARSAATDNQAVNVLMESEFSKYEIICMKTKHKFMIENLVKYAPGSEYERVYEERINNLGKEPTEGGVESYATVINPHLNRYWHEEGMLPPLGASQKKKAEDHVLKAFIYAMGMDLFVRGTSQKMEGRVLWFFDAGAKQLPVRSRGRLINNGYADLLDALRFNRKIKNYILYQAKIMMRSIKGFLDADEMMAGIQESWFVQDLAQADAKDAETGDENILDIFVRMYPNMKNNKWSKLFDGLQMTLFDFTSYLLEGNAQRVNEAYRMILLMIYGYSKAGKKDHAAREYAKQQAPIPEEYQLTAAEEKMKSHIADLLKKKYL